MKLKKIIFITLFFAFTLLSCSNKMKQEYNSARRLSKSYKAEDLEKAIKKYEKVINMKIEARDKQFLLYMRLGDKFLYRNMWNDALKNFKAAKEIKPNNFDVYYKLALCYSQLYRVETDKIKKKNLLNLAINNYKTALYINPKHVRSMYGLAILEFYFNNNQDKAFELINKILTIEPKNVDALFALGRFYYEIGEKNKSLNVYKKLVAILPARSDKMKEVKNNIERIVRELNE